MHNTTVTMPPAVLAYLVKRWQERHPHRTAECLEALRRDL